MIHPCEEILFGCAPPSRTTTTTTTSQQSSKSNCESSPKSLPRLNGTQLWGNLFKDISRLPIVSKVSGYYLEFSNSISNKTEDNETFRLKGVDFKNGKIDHSGKTGVQNLHTTSNDEHNGRNAKLETKRNESFEIDLHFNQRFNQQKCSIQIDLQKDISQKSKDDNGERQFRANLDANTVDGTLSVEMSPIDDSTVSVKINVPSNASVGLWRLIIKINSKIHNINNKQQVYEITGVHIT